MSFKSKNRRALSALEYRQSARVERVRMGDLMRGQGMMWARSGEYLP